MQGVTRIPDKYKDQFKDKNTELGSSKQKKKASIWFIEIKNKISTKIIE